MYYVCFRYNIKSSKKRSDKLGALYRAQCCFCLGSNQEDLDERFENLKTHLNTKVLTIYPIITYNGETYRLEASDKTGWEMPGLFTAMKCMVQICYVYNLEYSSVVAPFWEFVHRAFYGLPTTINFVELETLLGHCGIVPLMGK